MNTFKLTTLQQEVYDYVSDHKWCGWQTIADGLNYNTAVSEARLRTALWILCNSELLSHKLTSDLTVLFSIPE